MLEKEVNKSIEYLRLYHSIGKIWEDYHLLMDHFVIDVCFDIDKIVNIEIRVIKNTDDDSKHIDSFIYEYFKNKISKFNLNNIKSNINQREITIQLYEIDAIEQMNKMCEDLRIQLGFEFDRNKIHHSSGYE